MTLYFMSQANGETSYLVFHDATVADPFFDVDGFICSAMKPIAQYLWGACDSMVSISKDVFVAQSPGEPMRCIGLEEGKELLLKFHGLADCSKGW